MNGENLFAILMFVLGTACGALAAFPTDSRDNRIKAEGAVSVYEGRGTCEKALDQWVCSIPKD